MSSEIQDRSEQQTEVRACIKNTMIFPLQFPCYIEGGMKTPFQSHLTDVCVMAAYDAAIAELQSGFAHKSTLNGSKCPHKTVICNGGGL